MVAETLPNIGVVRRSGRVPRLVDRIRVLIVSLQAGPPEMGHPRTEDLEVDLALLLVLINRALRYLG